MIGIQVVAVGKIKEQWMRDGCAEYCKRMGLWSSVRIDEIEEHRLPAEPSPAQIAACIEKEGERILQKIAKGSRVVALCVEGKPIPSETLSGYLQKAAVDGADTACFVIGGSHGLSEAIKQRADLRLSISPMTFPHQLARVIVCEQVYRALSIAAGTKYHK